MSIGGALGAPMTAFQDDWNMLPVGQQLCFKHPMSYKTYLPLQAPETYNLDGILRELQRGTPATRFATRANHGALALSRSARGHPIRRR